MLRKSLQVLAAAILLGLLFTVGYAVLLGGPEKSLAEADALFARGDYARAVAVLDLSEPSVREDRTLRHRLWRRRLAAHQELGNSRGALLDIELLLAERPEDADDLQLEQVRLLAMIGQGERALALAEAYLATHPNDGRALEIAGEASQSLYQEDVRRVLATIARDAGRRDAERARTDLLSYLYRPDGDERIPQALQNLASIYRGSSQLLAAWPTLQRDLINLRGRIQLCIARFRASMEVEGEPVAAFRGLCLSLDQAERTDDLLLLCEAYRRRFDHQYVLEAGTFAIWALIRREQLPAALVAATRWLPPQKVDAMQKRTTFPSGLQDFLMARSFAAHRMNDTVSLQRFAQENYKLQTAGAPVQLAAVFSFGLVQRRTGRTTEAENSMSFVASRLRKAGVPIGQLDLFADVVRLRVDLAKTRSAPVEELAALYQDWVAARPGELPPLLALANHQLTNGQTTATLATLGKALDLAPYDEQLLARRIEAARRLHQDTDQDGPGLLAQCLRRGQALPEVNDPLGFLLCAQAALDVGEARLAPVALACARAAVDRFAWSELPRLLEARAELLAERPLAATHSLQKLLERGDPSPQVLQLALTARRAAGLSCADVVTLALQSVPHDAALAAAVLRCVPPTALAQAAPFAHKARPFVTDTPELAPLCAAVFAAAGEGAIADELLDPLRGKVQDATAEQRRELATAVLTRLRVDTTSTDAALAQHAERDLSDFALRHAAAAPQLTALAMQLADERPRTALVLLAAGLAHGGEGSRSGVAFAHAGELALRAGQRHLAEQHWTAALAFADGRIAVEPLTRLCLAEDRSDRAAQVYGLLEDASDLGLALRFGLRTPRSSAENLARLRLTADRTDLLAHLALAVIELPSAAPLDLTTAPQLDSLCEVIALASDAQLVAAAIPAASALVASSPASFALRLLHAHVLLQAGQVAAASKLHAQLFVEREHDTLLWGEAARATLVAGYQMPNGLAERLRTAVAKGELTVCPAATAFAMRFATSTVERAGHADLAQRLATEMWVALPQQTGATVATAEQVAARGDHLAAWWILERLGSSLPEADMPDVLRRQTELARAVLRTDPSSGAIFYDAALRHIERYGAQGCLLHFVLDHSGQFSGRKVATPRAIELLRAHLQVAANGSSRDPWVADTVRRLTLAIGTEDTAASVLAGLRTNPTCLPLWIAYTQLRSRSHSGQLAVAALRNVLTHAEDPQTRLQFSLLAARHFSLTPADAMDVVRLPQSFNTSTDGVYAAGLGALRAGAADTAVALLSRIERSDDGLHLLALAQALLQSSKPNAEATAHAAAVLTQLANDYASSSLAKNAGSFARQLAPHPANAPASPANR